MEPGSLIWSERRPVRTVTDGRWGSRLVPVVRVVAAYSHVGQLEEARTSLTPGGGDIRPVCRTCGWMGPKYGKADTEIALVGLQAHVATASEDDRYEIVLLTPEGL